MMKKTLACLLAALLALACLAPAVFAADVTVAHSVRLESASAGRVELVDLTADNLKDAVADPSGLITNGYYVADGATAVIALRAAGQYIIDSTSRVRVYPASVNSDIISGREYDNNYGEILNVTVLCDDSGQPIDEFGNRLDVTEVDAQGYERWEGSDKEALIYVGHFSNVTEDLVVKVYNVQSDSIGNVRDFLFSMFKFFENLLRWFFALTPFKK